MSLCISIQEVRAGAGDLGGIETLLKHAGTGFGKLKSTRRLIKKGT